MDNENNNLASNSETRISRSEIETSNSGIETSRTENRISRSNKKLTKKQVAIYTTIIIALIVVLGVLWFLIIDSKNSHNTTKTMATESSESSSMSYMGVKEITTSEIISDAEFASTSSDQNAVLATGNIEASLLNVRATKTGDSDGGDNTSFYGTNSAIIAKSGANLTIKNATITTDATGANGVFSYGGSAKTNNSSSDGTTVNISDSTIATSKGNSGGIMTTGGGTMNAKNLTIETSGTSSAAIRSDRGGGTVTVDEGTYKSNGKGSPAIYSTADITVKNAYLVSTASEGVVIEGKNSATLENVTLEDTNNQINGKSTTYKNIFLYQSMSGDAASGEAVFTAKDSNIITNQGDDFYVTNTTAKIILEDNTITNNDASGNFLRIEAGGWGKSGSNGGTVTMELNDQQANGGIIVDSISSLAMSMSNDSSYTGAINSENAGEVNLTLDASSKITLTGDSYVKSLNNADASNSNIQFNGHKLYVNGAAIN